MDMKMLGGLVAGGAALAGLAAYLVIGRKPEPPFEPAAPPTVSEPESAATPAPAPEESKAAPAVPLPKLPGGSRKAVAPAVPKSGGGPTRAVSNAPAPKPKPAPKPAYSGPREGVVLWSGELIKGGRIILAPGIAAGGTVSNEFPGVPIDVRVDLKGVSILETPSAADGWKRVVLRSETKGRKVVSIHWTAKGAN